MNKKYIIFLDIDGVLASYKYLCSSQNGPSRFIDPEKVALLNQLEGAEIVISSSWGEDGGRTEQSLRACGLTLPIIGYTQHFYQDWLCRGNEIEKWIHENIGGMGTRWGESWIHKTEEKYDYEYVIFDDNEDFLLGQKEHFVQTNEEFALTQEDIDKARKILKLQI